MHCIRQGLQGTCGSAARGCDQSEDPLVHQLTCWTEERKSCGGEGFEKKGNKDTVVRDRIEEEERKSRYMEETGMGKERRRNGLEHG